MNLSTILEPEFSSQIRQRGSQYFRQGLVKISSQRPDSLRAKVFGSAVYQVDLETVGGNLSCHCTCPAFRRDDCKHIWATILAAEKAGWPLGAQKKPSNGKVKSNWKRALEDLRLATAREPAQSVETFPADRRAIFLLDVEELASGHAELVIEVFGQRLLADGTWERPKQSITDVGLLLRSSNPNERFAAQILMGTGRDTFRWSGRKFYVSRASQELVLRHLCSIGRLGLKEADRPTEFEPLEWDDGLAWELWIENRPLAGGKAHELVGSLRRGAERRELSEPRLLLQSGLVLIDRRIGPFDHGGAWPLAVTMQANQSIIVDLKTSDAFLKEFLRLPRLPRLDLKGELSITEKSASPRPQLRVRKPEYHYDRCDLLPAELRFDYDGNVVSANHSHSFEPESRTLLRRDGEQERKFLERLLTMGFKEQWYAGDRGLVLNPARLPKVVIELLDAGWKVEADGALYRKPGEFKLSVSSGIDWFELNGTVDYGGVTIALPKLLSAMHKGEKTINLGDGTMGVLPEEWLAKYAPLAGMGEHAEDSLRFSRSQVGFLDALLADAPEARVDEVFENARRSLREFAGVKPADAPEAFVGQLREYQREGLGWIQFLQSFGFGGCLADDMGLGKTIQVLALLEQRRQTQAGPSLAVVPRSLVFNWMQEAARFTPKLRVLDHSHSARKRQGDHFEEYDLVLTTYGTLRRDAGYFKDVEFDYVILDEAQAIKNASTESAKAARLLRGRHRLALSGTPVENRLSELWSIFDFLNPGMLGGASVFKSLVGDGSDADGRALLARTLKPFILRRTKSQVARDLPAKTEQTIFCELPPKQRQAYNELRDYYRAALLKKIDEDGINRSQIMVLESLLRLRQAACHPGLIDPLQRDLTSAKTDALFEQLEEILAEGHKALVFSQFTSFLDIISRQLKTRNINYEYLDGKTRDRQARVDHFQSDPQCSLFLISLKAGGVGLNLTSADYVYLLDPWWNPAVEAQAIDRTHRIGQTRNVFAYRIISRDTVEEKVLELQKSKRELAEAIVTADNSLIGSLKREDIELLLS